MPFQVFMPRSHDDRFVEMLTEDLDDGVELFVGAPPPAYDLLVSGRPSEVELTGSDRLQALVIPFAGVPERTRLLLATHPELPVHNLHHNAAPTAEMAMALLLAAAKELVPGDQALRDGDWSIRYDTHRGLLLAGRTAVILGYGAVGRRIGALCEAFGMQVIGVRRTAVAPASTQAGVCPVEQLPDLLPLADVLVISLPETPATFGLLDAAALALLPEPAVLVNVARGSIIVEDALYERLCEGTLTAGLDVWWRYPESDQAITDTKPSAYPFDELPNVVMSPHRAGHGDQTERLRASHLADSLNAASRGEPIPNRVDMAVGY